MSVKSILLATSVALTSASSGFAASTQQVMQREPFMKTGARTAQPVGHYNLCKERPIECSATSAVKRPPRLSEIAWRVIQDVNTDVNRRILPMTDAEQFGREEVWTYPTGAGDCEDFVLLKRKELLARGFRVADLLITVVKKRDGTGHAVLTVSTSEGDFVLDNLDTEVRRWSETPYHYVKRQSPDDAGRWLVVENCVEDLPVASIKE